jgi:putative thioredoxin
LKHDWFEKESIAMGISVEVDSSSFMAEVIEPSYEKPVLVDFFAHWCGPCQMLKPMLEKLVQEYDFVLAKVDIDQNPDLASTYGIEGVPDVRIVTQGQVQQGFVGVLPEAQLRELLTQLNLKSDLETALTAVEAAIAAGETEKAKALFAQLIEQYPQDRKLAIAAAKFLARLGRVDSAEKLLNSIQENEKAYFAQAKALRELIRLKREGQTLSHDLEQPFFEAVNLAIEEAYEAALQGLLAIVSKDRKYRQDGARKTMILIFDLLGDDHPLTKHYRKQLTLTLY